MANEDSFILHPNKRSESGLESPIDSQSTRTTPKTLRTMLGDATSYCTKFIHTTMLHAEQIAKASMSAHHLGTNLRTSKSVTQSMERHLAAIAKELNTHSEHCKQLQQNHIKLLQDTAEKNATDAKELMTGIARNTERLNQIYACVEQGDRDLRGATQLLDSLSQKFEQIASTVQVIDDIAEQTNLLALNASIEAARAGEQGQGFAVVAEEVRKLAAHSSAATRSIAEILNALQNTADKTGANLANGLSFVSQAVSHGKVLNQETAGMIAASRKSYWESQDHLKKTAKADFASKVLVEEATSIDRFSMSIARDAQELMRTQAQLDSELMMLAQGLTQGSRGLHRDVIALGHIQRVLDLSMVTLSNWDTEQVEKSPLKVVRS